METINMMSVYNTAKTMTTNSNLELFAKHTILNMFPSVPVSSAYGYEENDAYTKVYNMMVPDVDMDAVDYSDWLCDKTDDSEFIRECLRRFDSVSDIAALIVKGE